MGSRELKSSTLIKIESPWQISVIPLNSILILSEETITLSVS